MHQTRKPTRTVAPTVSPLSLVQVKRHLALAESDDAHDQYLSDLIEFARDQWEDDTDYAVMSSTYTQTYERFPCDRIPLLRRPAASVSSIGYYDEDGSLQSWSSSNYRLDAGGAGASVVYDDDATLPNLDDRPEAVVVTYAAGVATAALVPPTIRQALLLLIAHAFEHRGVMHLGNFHETPQAYQSIANSYRRSSYP